MSSFLDGQLWIYVLVGVVFGYVVGAVPGFGGGNILAILVPFTLQWQPTYTIVFFSAVYATTELGGSWPGIILNVPGSPASAAASVDGYQMARKGAGDRALGLSIISAIVGLLVGTVVLVLLTNAIGSAALAFGPRELCALIILAMSFVTTLAGGSFYGSAIAGLAGLLISTVGTGPASGATRGTLGIIDLYNGLQLVPVVVGLFGFAECLRMASNTQLSLSSQIRVGRIGNTLVGIGEALRSWVVLGYAAAWGVVLGVIPGMGGTASSWIAYGQAKRAFGRRQKFGEGATAGVIAPELASHVGVPESLISMLALGIPHSAGTAILMSALVLEGVTPGPAFLTKNHGLVLSLGVSFVMSSLVVLVIGVLFSRYFASMALIPRRVIAPIIAVACLLGSYGARDSLFDMGTVVAFGVIGVIFDILDVSKPVFLLGFILGPMFETYLGQSLSIGNNSVGYFFGSPVAVTLLALAACSFAGPYVFRRRHVPNKNPRRTSQSEAP